MVLVYDRPLLRSSARGDGAVTSNNDRFTNVRTYAASDLSEPVASIPLRCIEATLANLTTAQASHPGTRIPLRCRQYAKTLLRKLACSIRGVLSVTDEGSTKSTALCPWQMVRESSATDQAMQSEFEARQTPPEIALFSIAAFDLSTSATVSKVLLWIDWTVPKSLQWLQPRP